MIADRATFGALGAQRSTAPLWTADLALPAEVTPQQAREAAAALQRLGHARSTTRPRSPRPPTRPGPARPGCRSRPASPTSSPVARHRGHGPGPGRGVRRGRGRARGRGRLRGRGAARPQPAARAGPAVRARCPPPRDRGPRPPSSCSGRRSVGAVAGAAVAGLLVATLGPAGRITSWLPAAAARTGLAALLAIALGATCAGVAAWSTDRRADVVAARRRPATGAVGGHPAGRDPGDLGGRAQHRRGPAAGQPPRRGVPAARRCVGRAARAAWPRAGRRTPVGARPGRVAALAGRSAGQDRRPATPPRSRCAWPSGLAVLGYALAVHRGVTEGIDDKVAAQVGARTVVELGDELAGPANQRPQRRSAPSTAAPSSTAARARLPPRSATKPSSRSTAARSPLPPTGAQAAS